MALGGDVTCVLVSLPPQGEIAFRIVGRRDADTGRTLFLGELESHARANGRFLQMASQTRYAAEMMMAGYALTEFRRV